MLWEQSVQSERKCFDVAEYFRLELKAVIPLLSVRLERHPQAVVYQLCEQQSRSFGIADDPARKAGSEVVAYIGLDELVFNRNRVTVGTIATQREAKP